MGTILEAYDRGELAPQQFTDTLLTVSKLEMTSSSSVTDLQKMCIEASGIMSSDDIDNIDLALIEISALIRRDFKSIHELCVLRLRSN